MTISPVAMETGQNKITTATEFPVCVIEYTIYTTQVHTNNVHNPTSSIISKQWLTLRVLSHPVNII
jgi:hypothetical protein